MVNAVNHTCPGRISEFSQKSKASKESGYKINASRGSCPSEMTRVNMNQIDLGAGLYQAKKNSKLYSHGYTEAPSAGPVLPTLSNVTQS